MVVRLPQAQRSYALMHLLMSVCVHGVLLRTTPCGVKPALHGYLAFPIVSVSAPSALLLANLYVTLGDAWGR